MKNFSLCFLRFKVFRSVVNGATPSLKRLAQQFLGIEIQTGEHSSVKPHNQVYIRYVAWMANKN